MLRGPWSLLAAAAATALLATACGPSLPSGVLEADRVECPSGSDCYDPPRAPDDGGSMTVQANDFAFFDIEGEIGEGDIAVTIVNQGPAEHNIFIGGANEGSEQPVQAANGEEATGTINLFAGEYAFWCTIPGHREAGMEGVLTLSAEVTDAAEQAIPLQELEG